MVCNRQETKINILAQEDHVLDRRLGRRDSPDRLALGLSFPVFVKDRGLVDSAWLHSQRNAEEFEAPEHVRDQGKLAARDFRTVDDRITIYLVQFMLDDPYFKVRTERLFDLDVVLGPCLLDHAQKIPQVSISFHYASPLSDFD